MFRFIFDIRAGLQPAAILLAALLSPALASAPLTDEEQPATPLPIPRGALIDPDADEMPALAASEWMDLSDTWLKNTHRAGGLTA